MKKFFIVFLTMLLLGINGIASATLLDQGGGVIYDNTNELYWIQDMSTFAGRTYQQQLDDIDALNTNASLTSISYGQWEMASFTNMEYLWAYSAEEIMKAFTPIRRSDGEYDFWYGRYNEIATEPTYPAHYMPILSNYLLRSPPEVRMLGLRQFYTPDTYTDQYYGAWVVAQSVTPVPEPNTLILFGIGCLSFAGHSRRRKV